MNNPQQAGGAMKNMRSGVWRRQPALVAALIVFLGAASDTIERNDIQATVTVEEIPFDSRLVVAWNELAYEIAFAEDQFLTFKGHRAFCMMHLAIHDALNTILPVYERYAYSEKSEVAQPLAAAAQAAYSVLLSQYPGQQGRLAAELMRWLGEVPNGSSKRRGIELGKKIAALILALRADDGWDFPGMYEFERGPGQYQTTPPWNGVVAQPGFRFAKPFALAFQAQFRPPPSPSLKGTAYTQAFREVKEYGSIDSTLRSEEQTAYAVWWMEFAEGSVNRLGRQLVTDRSTNLWTAARMFAYLNMALFDGYIATWDSKYEYNHWRPFTAIREADNDDNPKTTSDPAWEPLRTTPPFPEYVSAHATGCAATMEVLEQTFGNAVPFAMATTTAPLGMPTRSFPSFGAAANECADSRVRLGWHFRYATDAGLALGRTVARYVVRNYLRRSE